LLLNLLTVGTIDLRTLTIDLRTWTSIRNPIDFRTLVDETCLIF